MTGSFRPVRVCPDFDKSVVRANRGVFAFIDTEYSYERIISHSLVVSDKCTFDALLLCFYCMLNDRHFLSHIYITLPFCIKLLFRPMSLAKTFACAMRPMYPLQTVLVHLLVRRRCILDVLFSDISVSSIQ